MRGEGNQIVFQKKNMIRGGQEKMRGKDHLNKYIRKFEILHKAQNNRVTDADTFKGELNMSPLNDQCS